MHIFVVMLSLFMLRSRLLQSCSFMVISLAVIISGATVDNGSQLVN